MKKTLLVVLILFAVFIGIGQGQSPVIGLGGTCASISGCPALTQSNTFTQPQTFNGTNSVHINNAGVNSQIYSETPSYSYAAWVFASYGNYDALIANGTSEHVPFVGYTELTGTQPFSDTATGDVWLNAGSSSNTIRLYFQGQGTGASAVQISATNAQFNSIPVSTTALKLGGVPVTQAAAQPTGACSTLGWILSNDGHITFCTGTTYVSKV